MMDRWLRRLRFSLLYTGSPPWDTGISPPELLEYLAAHPAGRALDLGCGTGTNSITMARQGWQVTGVDFIPRAVRQGRRKARQQGVPVDLRVGDVTRLERIAGPFQLILDMGCYHGLSPAGRAAYQANIRRLLAEGGSYLMYAHLKDAPDDVHTGITETDVGAFEAFLHLDRRVDGMEGMSRKSAWFWWSPR